MIFIKGSDLSELENRINEILEQLIDWCRFNKLSVNICFSQTNM